MSIRNAPSYLAAISMVASSVAAYTAPSTESKFTDVLSLAELQYPVSVVAATSDELLDGFAASYFYLTDDLYMQFQIAGSSNRCELRQLDSDGDLSAWDCTGSTKQVASATLAIPVQADGLEEVTIMQIHDTLESPALRISWVSSITIDGVTSEDVIISTIREGLDDDSDTTKTVLQAHTTSRTEYEITAESGLVSITVDGETMLDEASISAYSSSTCYFKAGAYNNNPTDEDAVARTKFYELDW
ncbi:alginate lyase 2 [Calycina marina]|uniref:Alginate lyase 2 n=1 Tax=Calycina marina TaxID=1763456 RepID=A0A9P7YUZ3_9HELO|nr:alginate lyase 2 [Calycina marina]